MGKHLGWGGGILLLICVIIELVLRFVFGFCDAVLYQSSEAYEYIAQPNQYRYRFFSHINYNSYSQRSEEPDFGKTIVLGLGDSVIFGGTIIDQNAIATTLFSTETGMQMLNISSGSWGPDNCAAYLREKGIFEAKIMILVCSSHDAYDLMSHAPVVGIFPNYPKKQYRVAIWEAMDRYMMPKIKRLVNRVQLIDPDAQLVKQLNDGGVVNKSAMFNPGFEQLKEIARENNIPFLIYLHPEIGEIINSGYKDGGRLIIEWAKDNNVPLFQELIMGVKVDMYRDVIHFNEKGQRLMADNFIKIIKRLNI